MHSTPNAPWLKNGAPESSVRQVTVHQRAFSFSGVAQQKDCAVTLRAPLTFVEHASLIR